MSPAMPLTLVQVPPEKCQVPVPGVVPDEAPNTQTFFFVMAVIPVNCLPGSGVQLGTVAHLPSAQFSTYPPRWLTAQIFFGEAALAATIQLVRPAGSTGLRQPWLIQRSTMGRPVRFRFVPPKNQASLLCASTTS